MDLLAKPGDPDTRRVESISETELWRSDDNGDSSVHGVDPRLETDHLMRGLLLCGTETAVVPLLRGARFLY